MTRRKNRYRVAIAQLRVRQDDMRGNATGLIKAVERADIALTCADPKY